MGLDVSTVLAEKLKQAFEENGQYVSTIIPETPQDQIDDYKRLGESYYERLRDENDMPVNVQAGDIYLIKLNGKSANGVTHLKSTVRPVIIWAVYRDQEDKVRAVDIFHMSTKLIPGRPNYPHDLSYDEKEMHLVGANKAGEIRLSSIFTLPWFPVSMGGPFLEYAGRKGRVDASVFPHMIIRRYETLTQNPGNIFSRQIRIHPQWTREGLFLPASTPIRSGGVPPEIDCKCHKLEKLFQGYDQDMIFRLTHWSDNFRRRAQADRKPVVFPGPSVPYESWTKWSKFSNPNFTWTPPEGSVPHGLSYEA